MIPHLLYPVMLYRENASDFFICKDEVMLKSCNIGALKQKYYENLLVIDCAGKEYQVINAIKIGVNKKTTRWWDYLLGNYFIEINLNFDMNYMEKRDVDFVKKIIMKDFEENFQIWREYLNINLILKRIEMVDSIQKLYAIVLHI